MRRLLVSFWDIALSNLPDGIIGKRRLSADEARSLISLARAAGAMVCVAADDLGAPYHERARQQHRQLCTMLRDQLDIEIGLEDFFGSLMANPLAFAEVGEQQSLLVVDCCYTVGTPADLGVATSEGASAETPASAAAKSALGMSIAFESIEFHLFEKVG